MWRFAVYTHKTSILGKTCLKAGRLALKHTDGRADFFRYSKSEAASAPTISMDKEQPIREVFSLDDFGLISVNRSQSVESINSSGSEHTFLDQLFRNDTLNTFSNVQIPTTMSSNELGGVNEVFEYDYVSDLLSGGAVAEELAEEEGFYHDDQEPGTSGLEASALPFLIPKTSGTENLGELMFPESLPVESYTSQWKDEDVPILSEYSASAEAAEKSESDSDFSLEVIEGIAADGNMTELRKELEAVGTWPEYIFTGDRRTEARIGFILRFIVDKSESFAEAETIIKKFASSHYFAVVPDDVLIQLAIKSITDSCTIPSIMKTIETLSTFSARRELRPNRPLVKSSLSSLYTAAVKKSPKTSPSLLSLCIKLNFDNSSKTFLECFAEHQASCTEKSFVKNFEEWKTLSKRYGSQQGIDHYWIEALKSEEEDVAKRVSILLTHSGKSEHPFATIGRMLCALVKLDKLEKAVEVFKVISVSGRHFRESLASFVEQNDLASIERLASLIERGMIAERKRGGRKRATSNKDKTTVATENSRLLGADVYSVLAKFCGVREIGEKFVDKNVKKKMHRVDEEQLHEICKALQKAWVTCSKDRDSMVRLVEWCQKNRIEIDEKVQMRINVALKDSQ